jgi:CubicO group peptidase (beta-lactamase class C family)
MNQHPQTSVEREHRGHGGMRALVSVTLLALALTLLVVLTPAAQASAKYSGTIRDGRAAARALLAQTGAPSLSLALVSQGHVVWRQSFGYADVATHTAPAATTMYGLGSVSKTLAAVAVMQLVDEGKVDLDEPLVTYLPEFRMASPGYRGVTVRMLLDHSSGFPGSAYASAWTTRFWPGYLDQVMSTLTQSRLKHTPGALSVYCNDGFTVLEELVLAVTGRSFAEYIQEDVFAPLGMTHTAYPLHDFADGSYAKAYDPDGTAHPRETLNLPASGALYSTPSDMARLATMLMSRGAYGDARILSAASVAEMGSDQTVGEIRPSVYDGTRYGLGWDSVTQPGLKKAGFTAWMKGGDSSDYHAGFIVVPKQKLAAVVLGVAPINSGLAEGLCERILLHALVDRGSLRRMPTPLPAAAPAARAASAPQLRAMEGYWAGNSLVFKVDAGSDPQSLTLSALRQGAGWQPLSSGWRMRANGQFYVKGNSTSLWTTTAAGRRYLIDSAAGGYGHYRDNMPLAQKLTPGEPLSAAWAARLGHLWLAVNEQPTSGTYASGGPLFGLTDVPGLPGYVVAVSPGYGMQIVDPGESDDDALMFLQIPGFGSRDMNDVVVEQRGAEDWIWYGTTFYRPLETVPALLEGDNLVSTDGDGYAEWRSLAAAARVTIDTGSGWRLYDAGMNVVDEGTSYPADVTVAAGGYLCLFAPVGTNATVHVTPGVEAGAGAPPAHRPVIQNRRPSLEELLTPAL